MLGIMKTRTSRCLLASSDDLKVLCNILEGKDQINLWCNASDGNSNSSSKTKKRKRESDDENIDTIYRDLKEKHGDAYSIPQLRLWARMLQCSTHESYDKPPLVPMFSQPQPKRPKQSLSDSITQGFHTALSKGPYPQLSLVQSSQSSQVQSSPVQSSPVQPFPVQQGSLVGSCSVSPGKNIELRMKNLEQLRYLQKLFEDNILTDIEFMQLRLHFLNHHHHHSQCNHSLRVVPRVTHWAVVNHRYQHPITTLF